MNYYFKALRNYVTFSGRASRSEYWYFFLFNVIITFSLSLMTQVLLTLELSPKTTMNGIIMINILLFLYQLAVLIPTIAVGVRRMHDIGKSGWFALIPIYNLILACTKGTKGENKYGADPKAD
jgi:uncharacterized membrane protein YhaH (DUF805 family)